MDKREILRLNMKFGKFLDPILLLTIVGLVCISILAVFNLTARTHSAQEATSVLGVDTEEPRMKLIQGKHSYITDEKLERISESHFKYTAFIQKRPSGKISKPILHISQGNALKVQVAYTNSNTSKISLVNDKSKISYLVQNKVQSLSPDIKLGNTEDIFYLLVENENPVLFKQYLELNFFLNR